MARRFGRDQLEAVLASDLDEGARVVWTYLALVCRRGIGKDRLRERLDLVDFDGAMEVLEDERLIKNVGGKWLALAMMVREVEDEDGDVETEHTPVRVMAEEMLVEYNAARTEAGLEPPVVASERQFAKLEELAEWLTESGVSFVDFLQFGVERTAWMSKREQNPVVFPPLSILVSPWIRDEFTQVPRTKKATGHAGKSYGTHDGIRAQLTAAGFKRAGRMTPEELRHVVTWAENMVADPDGFPEPDLRWREEIAFVVRRMKVDKGGDRARRA